MGRRMMLVALALLICFGAVGCAAVYYHSEGRGDHRQTGFGLLGGLLPLYRSKVELEEKAEK